MSSADGPTFFPFSFGELLRAYRVFFPEAEAYEMARGTEAAAARLSDSLRDGGAPTSSPTFVPQELAAVPGVGLHGMSLSDDTLITLSLISDDVAQKVEMYRARLPYDATMERAWKARRDELASWVTRRLHEIDSSS
jgi:hypothetical protein